MSFTLVAYDLLKSNVQESVNTLIREHGEDPQKLEESLKKLPAVRRVQATYLLHTINLLDASTQNTRDKSRILNAATYYIRYKIGQSYRVANSERSTFFNSLTTSLALNNENQPQRDDLVDMYGPLEQFMRSHIYKSSDPRKGYLEVQPYDITDYSVKEQIKHLAKKLFVWKNEIYDEAELKYQKNLSEKRQNIISKGFLCSLGDSSEITNEEYKLIKGNVKKSVIRLIRYYDGDPVKLEESLQKLPTERRIQATFLLKTIYLLDNSPIEFIEKTRILNAAAYFVRDEIGLSYKWISPERSILFKSLSALVFNTKNKLAKEDAVDLYEPLEKFMRLNVYVSGDPREGYLEKQPYFINGYSVKDHIKMISAKLFERRNELFDIAEAENQKNLENKPNVVVSTGFFGGFFGSTTQACSNKNEQGVFLGGFF